MESYFPHSIYIHGLVNWHKNKILPTLTLTIWPAGDRFQILGRYHSCNHCHAAGTSCIL